MLNMHQFSHTHQLNHKVFLCLPSSLPFSPPTCTEICFIDHVDLELCLPSAEVKCMSHHHPNQEIINNLNHIHRKQSTPSFHDSLITKILALKI